MRRILSSFAVYAAQDDGIDAVVELSEWRTKVVYAAMPL
jgi:hypothetical protein